MNDKEKKQSKTENILLIGGIGSLGLALLLFLRKKAQGGDANVLNWLEIVEDNVKGTHFDSSLGIAFILGIIDAESGGDYLYQNPERGRYGLLGVPIYQSAQFREVNNMNISIDKLLEPGQNLKYGIKYLDYLADACTQSGFTDLNCVASVYDLGRLTDEPLYPNKQYVDRVMSATNKYLAL